MFSGRFSSSCPREPCTLLALPGNARTRWPAVHGVPGRSYADWCCSASIHSNLFTLLYIRRVVLDFSLLRRRCQHSARLDPSIDPRRSCARRAGREKTVEYHRTGVHSRDSEMREAQTRHTADHQPNWNKPKKSLSPRRSEKENTTITHIIMKSFRLWRMLACVSSFRCCTIKVPKYTVINTKKLNTTNKNSKKLTYHHHECKNPGGSPSVIFFSHRI